jgi:quinohemoprotein ethanol dehydrogenase
LSVIGMPADPKMKAQVLASVRGYLKAWDPATQKEVWRVEQPGAWNGGVLSTAGGLVFQGNSAGQFNAYSADKGDKLWSFPTQSGVIAAPISYAVGGQQYVVVVVGEGGTLPLAAGEIAKKGALAQSRSRVLAFRLGGTAALPPASPPPPRAEPPARFLDATKLLPIGMTLYKAYCSVCHGDGAVGGGVVPDLRWSPMVSSAEGWRGVVLDGTHVKNGMVSFAQVLTPDFAELIRGYVVDRANEAYPSAP